MKLFTNVLLISSVAAWSPLIPKPDVNINSRREVITKTLIAGSALLVAPAVTNAYTLPDLPYPFEALEPYIDAPTMKIHHDKHHATYVANINKVRDNI